jgi:glycosyltransferase involved in cell wall biosynthesis
MNLGVECSDSQYIAFIDADDIWYPDKLASQVKVLDDCQNIGLVYCNGQAIDSNGKHLYMLFDNDHQEKSISENILLNCYIRTPSMVMIRRKILEKSGLFVEKYFYSKDHDLWVKIAELSRLHYIPTCLVGYRIHAQQQSGRRNQWDEGFGVLSDACQRQPRYARIKKKRLAVLYYRIALCEWKHANRLRAVWLLAKAMRNDPNRALWHLVSSSLQGLKG